jgi:ice-binding like protein
MTHPKTPARLFQRSFASFGPVVVFALLLTMGLFKPALAQTAPSLGTAQNFAVLGSTTVTNTGPSVITGDLGVYPGTAVTGFPPGIVDGGSTYAADAQAKQARADATTAYGDLAGQTCNTTYAVPTDLGGMTLVPGVYCFASSAAITGTLTLNEEGNPDSVFIFFVPKTLITASNASVAIINGAQQGCDVFWHVGSSATLGTGTNFIGTVIALTKIALDTNATMSGRALALNGEVTLDSNAVSANSCAATGNSPPVISKSFNTPSITAGGTSTLTLTLSNSDSTAATITSPLIDTFPSGMLVSGAASTTCGGGTVSAVIGQSVLTLTGGTIPADGNCTVTVAVTAPDAGNFINSVPAGALITSNGNNVSPAVATLTVTTPGMVPPTLGKSFSPATISMGGVAELVLTLSNGNSVVDTMTAPLTDHLPVGLTVDGAASTTCGGTVDALKGSKSVTLTGGAIPANGSCTVSVNVSPDCGCAYHNSVRAGALKTDNGNNAAPAAATLTVTKTAPGGPPKLGKFFFPDEIRPGGVTTLTITLTNPDAAAATLTAPLTDDLPSGMVVSGLPGNGADNTCGGTLTATKGSSSITLTGGEIPADGSCKITIFVSVQRAGTFVNLLHRGALKTSKGSNADQAKASLFVSESVGGGTQLLKSFSPATIKNDGVSTLTITLKNSETLPAKLTSPLIDYMPKGMVVHGGASNTCGGAVKATVGKSTVILTGGAIPANGSCTVTVKVTAPCNSYFNNLPRGALQTSNGSNEEPAGASLTVTPD